MEKFLFKVKKVLLLSVLTFILPLKVSAENIPHCTPGLGTVKNFLATAMQPVGQTLYIWGGGWKDDGGTYASETARHIGVWPQWKEFFDSQNSSYNFLDYAISEDGESKIPIPAYRPLGLDCSGYRGWILYNVFHNKDMEGAGYVFPSGRTAGFIDNDWGVAIKPEDIQDFKAGDIMAKPGHTYIVIGQCSDGSVVFVHSSPPGVHICGTVTPTGNEQSEAIALAANYMKKYYPEYDEKYSHHGYVRSGDYLTQYTQLRWNTDGAMKDPDGYTEMTAEQVLKDLFNEN